jgi:hypothetical protein
VLGVVVLGRFVDRDRVELLGRRALGDVQRTLDGRLGRVVEFGPTDPQDLEAVVVVGLCDAETTTPAPPRCWAITATPGVVK